MNAAVRSRWTIATSAAAVLLAVVALVLVVTRLGSVGGETGDAARIVPATPPTPPRALPESGALVDAVVQADGTVRVTHWLRTRDPVDRLTLTVASGRNGESGAVSDLRVLTTQGQLDLLDPRVDSRPRLLLLQRPTALIRLDYTLDGVTERSDDSAGRALVRSVALAVPVLGESSRAVVRVDGETVLALSCARAGRPPSATRPCGRPVRNGWTVELSGRATEDVVAAQVDLDDAGS